MSVDNWIRLGAGIWVGASVFIILFVYCCFVVQIVPAEPDEQAEEQPPELDDEIRYLTSSTYPTYDMQYHVGSSPKGRHPAVKFVV